MALGVLTTSTFHSKALAQLSSRFLSRNLQRGPTVPILQLEFEDLRVNLLHLVEITDGTGKTQPRASQLDFSGPY